MLYLSQQSHRAPSCAIVGGIIAIALLALAACDSPTVGPTPTASATATTAATATTVATATTGTSGPYHVLVYFSKNPDSQQDPTKVFPVDRYSPTLAVATYAIGQLIAGPTSSEAAAGYYSYIHGKISGTSNCGGADFTITLDHKGPTAATGYVTLKFCRTVNLPGDLSGTYISSEIDATLLQFANNHKVVILNAHGDCFNDLSGQNLCLQ